MKIYKIITCLFLAFAGCLLAGCNDTDNDWQMTPPPETSNNMTYFPLYNNASHLFTPDVTQLQFDVSVERSRSTGAATIPLSVVRGSEWFAVPTSVDFAAGQDSTGFVVTLTNTETFVTRELEIALDEGQIDYYTKDGSGKMTFSTVITQWVEQYPDIAFNFSQDFDPFTASIWELRGANRYRIDDFLGSGESLEFSLQGNEIVPGAQYDVTNSLWTFGEGTSRYPINPAGSRTATGTTIYVGASYTYMNLATKAGCFYLYMYYTDGEAWNQLKFTLP